MQWDGKKHRPIDPLYKPPKRLLKKLHRFLQNHHLCHPAAHGGVRRRSTFTSAQIHVGSRNVWTRDVTDCYPSISQAAMFSQLRKLKFQHDTALVLSMLFTYRDGVPQGSPISGDALNIFFWPLDQLLASMAGSLKLRYGRNADDFVWSGSNRENGDKLAARLESEIELLGLKINEKKKRANGLQTSSDERLVHGISVSKPSGTAISRLQSKKALALGEKYVAACRSVTADSLEAVAVKRAQLAGWMYYCRQAHIGPARTIRQLLEAGDRHVLKKLRAIGLSSQKNKWWIIDYRPRRNKPSRNEPKRLANAWRTRLARMSHKNVVATGL
ncbi:reverse transcriptase domain-containing protein [Aeoliella mucimassa]|nr:reverse transcriptase domain-containing protein [Aeoliella mucimassa]